jgi:tetratricopeptide (TPR) repeat protein
MRPAATVRRALTAGLLAAIAVSASAQVAKETLTRANEALQAGEADKAISLLQSIPKSGPGVAEAHNLLCRVRFTLEQWNAAAQECEQAVEMDQQNSNYHLWLGRALGEKASRASFLTAYSLGKRTRAEFEEAVRLDPRNAAALADLGEFYQSAPGIVGGGMDKAERIAGQLDKVDPARAHELRARIAEARKDYTTADSEFKEAVAVSTHPAFQWSSLASFCRHRQRWEEMDWAIRNCASAAAKDRHAGVALYNGATVLIQANRNPEMAAKMIEDYLAGTSKTEEAPAFVALIKLARLKQKLGDSAGAQQDRLKAQALASEYKPAWDSKN